MRENAKTPERHAQRMAAKQKIMNERIARADKEQGKRSSVRTFTMQQNASIGLQNPHTSLDEAWVHRLQITWLDNSFKDLEFTRGVKAVVIRRG